MVCTKLKQEIHAGKFLMTSTVFHTFSDQSQATFYTTFVIISHSNHIIDIDSIA